jgi:hypothetical protein
VVLAVGAVIWIFVKRHPIEPPKRAPVVQALPDIEPLWRPEPVPPRAVAAPTPWIDESLEPILARPEPLADPVASAAVLSVAAGISEGDASEAPRPDADVRRMPYADERRESWMSQVTTWLQRLRPTPASQRDGAEESEDPPNQVLNYK